MADIIESVEVDRDTIDEEALERKFIKKYNLCEKRTVYDRPSYYISKITGNKSNIAVTLSNNSIEVYNLIGLSKVCKLSGHPKAITDLVFSPQEEHILYSSSQDGIVKMWDIRTNGLCVQEYKDEKQTLVRPYDCMDVSCNGRVLCAGTQMVEDDAYLVFWDQRNTVPLGGYWNSHTDDITQVKFHKEKMGILATGSLDGLVNIFNIMELTEDDALTYSLNVGNSTQKLSWLDDTKVACITQSHDLQIWNTATGDLVKSLDRDKISRNIKRSKSDDCYLVDTFCSSDNTTVLLAGSYGGDGHCLRSVTIEEKKVQPCSNFKENSETVLCCWYNKQMDQLITAGEAAIISVWGTTPSTPAAIRRCSHRAQTKRRKPY